MLILSPDVVRFDSWVWDDCTLIAVDRSARRIIEDYSDLGPFPQFVDVPERAVSVKLTRRVRSDDAEDPPLGHSGTLRFYLNSPGTDTQRTRIEITCVLTHIHYDVPAAGAEGSAAPTVTKVLTFAAFHAESQDPVTFTTAVLTD